MKEALWGWRPDDGKGFRPTVHYANRYVCRPGEVIGPRVIGDYQWLFVEKGSGVVEIASHRYPARPRCLIAYGPDMPHRIEASDNDPMVLYGIHFHPAGDQSVIDPMKVFEVIRIRAVGADEWRTRMNAADEEEADSHLLETGLWPLTYFQQLAEEYAAKPAMNQTMMNGIFTQLAVKLYRWKDQHQTVVGPLESMVAAIRHQLELSAGEAYSPQWLESWSTYSHDYVARLFRERTGLSPHAYHNEMKLNAAKRLLEQTELTSTEIAERLHLSSVHYFCKWFKRWTGVAPLFYRESRRVL